jgi:hypothetical protein
MPQLAKRPLCNILGGVLGAGQTLDVVDDECPMLAESEL